MSKTLSDAGLAFIQGFEGYHTRLPDGRCQAYRCIIGRDRNGQPIHDGKWTIGFGCTEGTYEGLIWTRQQADEAFRRELATHEAAVDLMATVPLSQNQFDALVSFSYNCGTGALKKSSILAKLNAGDAAGAARCFALYNKSKGIVVSGLVRRRAEETAVFMRPDAPAPEPEMPQQVDVPAAAPTGSRKVAVANAGQATMAAGGLGLAGLSVSDSLGYGGQVLALVKTYGLEAVIVLAFVAAIGFAFIKYRTRQDFQAGRYTPSGATK